MHYIIHTAFLCKYSFLIIMCVLLQGDSCEEVGVQLVQTLTVVFPPPIRGGLIGKSPSFQLSTPNSKPEANLPEFRVTFSKRMYWLPQIIHTEWSLQLLFTKPLTSSCPLASSSKIILDSSNLMVSPHTCTITQTPVCSSVSVLLLAVQICNKCFVRLGSKVFCS